MHTGSRWVHSVTELIKRHRSRVAPIIRHRHNVIIMNTGNSDKKRFSDIYDDWWVTIGQKKESKNCCITQKKRKFIRKKMFDLNYSSCRNHNTVLWPNPSLITLLRLKTLYPVAHSYNVMVSISVGNYLDKMFYLIILSR